MKKFYGVMTEVYDNAAAEACLIYGEGKKPPNSLASHDGLTVYKDWYETERAAKRALAIRKETLKKLPA